MKSVLLRTSPSGFIPLPPPFVAFSVELSAAVNADGDAPRLENAATRSEPPVRSALSSDAIC